MMAKKLSLHTFEAPTRKSVMPREIMVILVASDTSLSLGVTMKTEIFSKIINVVRNHMKKMDDELGVLSASPSKLSTGRKTRE